MEVVGPRNSQEFLDRAEAFLLEDEARHHFIIGTAGAGSTEPWLARLLRCWIVEDGGVPVAAAIKPDFQHLYVSAERVPGALSFLASSMHEEGVPLTGVNGALPEVDVFANAWVQLTGAPLTLRMRQRVLQLATRPQLPTTVLGAARDANTEDRPRLIEWGVAFNDEVRGFTGPVSEHDARKFVDEYLERDAGAGLFVWEDGGELVSLLAYSRPTPSGIYIGPIFTPVERRRRGYARALLAAASARLLDGGRKACFLYTDAANPISNAVVTSVGYSLICEAANYSFRAPRTGR